MSNWVCYPSTMIEYDFDNSGLPDINTVDDIDAMFMWQLKNRIRYKIKGSDEYNVVPVVFYNENDRQKTMAQSPIIIVNPMPPIPWEEQINNFIVTQSVTRPDGASTVIVQDSPVWHTFTYKVTLACTEWRLYRRLYTFLRHQVFALRGYEHVIIISVDHNDPLNVKKHNLKTLNVLDESQSEDYEQNWFQYDITFEFRLAIYIGIPVEVPTTSVDKRLDVCSYEIIIPNFTSTSKIIKIYDKFNVLPLGYPYNSTQINDLINDLMELDYNVGIDYIGDDLTIRFIDIPEPMIGVILNDGSRHKFGSAYNCRNIPNPDKWKLKVGGLPPNPRDLTPGTAYIGVGAVEYEHTQKSSYQYMGLFIDKLKGIAKDIDPVSPTRVIIPKDTSLSTEHDDTPIQSIEIENHVCGENIPINVPVVLIDGKVYRMSADKISHAKLFLGFSINASSIGTTVQIRTIGFMEVSGWGLTPNTYYMVGINGSLVTIDNGAYLYNKIVGYSINSNKLRIVDGIPMIK